MRIFSFAAAATLALLTALSMSAMNNADLLKLKAAAFSDDTILASIDKEPADYDTSADALVQLKKAGLSEAIINRVLAKASPPNGVPPAAPGSSAAPVAAGVAPIPAVPSELFSIESPSIAPAPEDPVAGKDYFTRFSFHVEEQTYLTTNYARGALIAINTPVHVVAISHRRISLKRIDNGEPIYIENVEKYSRKTIAEVARLMLSSEQTPLSRLAPVIANSILIGEMRKGMTKEQVLMARGYPPAHETASIGLDHWVYWSSRFVKQTILFANGRLTEGRDLQ